MLPRKYRIHALLLGVALLIIFIPLFNKRPPADKAAAASVAATRFLQEVDADRFAESWRLVAPPTQTKFAQQNWTDGLQKIRSVTGPLLQRSEVKMTVSIPDKDSPKGEYIVITYDSRYQNRADASEVVTVMRSPDGIWRVAGYYVK